MLTQWRSNTGPFYKMFFNQKSNEIVGDFIYEDDYEFNEIDYINALDDLLINNTRFQAYLEKQEYLEVVLISQ